ncbi:MAG: hypothetical protein AAB466_10270 [Verrucomicrobiota bacterium]
MIRLTQRYVTALRKHLKQGPRASLQSARGLGCWAVAIGLETLDVARIHEGALATLEASSSSDGIIKRAEIFFTEAITPIVETHRAARQSKVHLSRLKETLGQRTEELAATNRQLQRVPSGARSWRMPSKKAGSTTRNVWRNRSNYRSICST